jgi:pre-mRNA-splicing factor CDC5/CEF1
MKYGLNQWARISSLLTRKSAKQCKARWYEWLDPAIKKTEWTREEDEKLLHLAKLMPTQWRTIAPIVGRTPTQCLERYEKLLDMASGREEGYEAKDDPRRLRPGEIDPHPETKPARPDPVDMDDDEKEMLSEARARLANTRGKKAKRKAREKQLEEARRLAALQKKRELKAAGIDVREKAKKGRGIDYAHEVPFERRPAPGFYDVAEENEMTRAMREEFRPVTKDELEGRKRKDIEKELIKQDVAKRKIAERKDAPNMIAQQLAAHEALQSTRRGKMMLPAPQVTDAELEALARDASMEGTLASETGSQATRALLGDYSTPAPFATPMATPAAGPSGMNKVMQEAQALARLREGQTPLLGGENPDIAGSDFSGIAPQRNVGATPNPLATAAAAKIGATPATARGVMQLDKKPATVQPTPVRRDELKLNAENGLGEDSNHIASALSNLPAPKGGYQLAPPEMLDEEEDGAVPMEEDAADAEARIAAEKARQLEEEKKLRSHVVQRNLPRPLSLDLVPKPATQAAIAAMSDEGEAARHMILQELVQILNEDAKAFPANMPITDSMTHIDHGFSVSELEAAAKLIDDEVPTVKKDLGHDGSTLSDYSAVWDSMRPNIMYSVELQRYSLKSKMSEKDILASLKHEYETVRKEMSKCAKRAGKVEQKVGIVLGGLQKRSKSLTTEINEKTNKANISKIEKTCYRQLQDQERLAASARLEHLKELVEAQESRERTLQEKYKSLQS